MSISVSRESISKLMTELVDSFPMEADERASISDFGKMLFTEGQSSANGANGNGGAQSNEGARSRSNSSHSSSNDNTEPDDEASAKPTTPSSRGNKRAFTEIKGVPRQKQHDIMKSKDKAVPQRWTQEEDDKLRDAVSRHGERNWKSIADEVPGRNHTQCLQRWTKVLAPGLVKGHWRPDEDEMLKELVAEGRKNWGQVATRIPGRTSKQCRERWYNHLDPSIIRGEYTPEEDRLILEAQARLGNRWSAIAAMLPGRTEDAVKIRWKSLCRVRKGPGRRAQGEKGKPPTPKSMGGHGMMHGGGFGGPMIKSEELAPFNSMQSAPMGRMGMGGTPSGMGMYAPHPMHMGMGGNPSMMYPSEMRTGSAYDPTMGPYRKTPMQAGTPYGQSLPPTVPTHEYGVDRRNMVGMASNGMGPPPPGYRYGPPPPTPAASYMMTGQDMNGTPVYSNMNGGGYAGTPMTSMYRPQTMMSPHMSPHHQQPMHSSMGYGYSMAPSTPASGGHNMMAQQQQQQQHMNVAGNFTQQQQQQQYMQPPAQQHEDQQQQQEEEHHQPQHPPSPQQEQARQTDEAHQAAPTSSSTIDSNASASAPSPVSSNPALAFAQQAAAAAANNSPKPPAASTMMTNPVAAFLQKQQQPTPPGSGAKSTITPLQRSSSNSSSSSGAKQQPFNPAAAFAQRLQKPPTANKPSSNNGDDQDEDASGNSGAQEPSLKKVKPRLSLEAARASAARRMRSSGSGSALAGRGSLDVFLNEIGDVGRLSDLKMDEFQTLDELWRVSDDMNRLSL